MKPRQLSNIVKKLFAKANLDAHGQIVRYHSLRKYLFSSLCKVMSEGYSKAIVGKAIDLAVKAYLNTSPENLRELYTKAMPDIVLNGNGTELKHHVNTLEEKNKILEAENLKLREEMEALKKEQNVATSTTAKNETLLRDLAERLEKLEGKGKQ